MGICALKSTPMKEMNPNEVEEKTSEPTEALGFRALGYEKQPRIIWAFWMSTSFVALIFVEDLSSWITS